MSYKLSPVPHGNFWDQHTQTYTGLTSGQTIYIRYQDADSYESGMSVVNGTDIYFTNPGHYLLVFSIIASQSSGTNVYYNVWLQDNGVDVPWSNTRILVKDAGVETLIAASVIGYSDGTNYMRMKWQSSSANGRLLATTGLTSPTRPDIPSILLTLNKISE